MNMNKFSDNLAHWLRNLADKTKTSDISYDNHILALEASYGLSPAEAIKRTNKKYILTDKDEILNLPEILEKKNYIVCHINYTDSGASHRYNGAHVGVDMRNEQPINQ